MVGNVLARTLAMDPPAFSSDPRAIKVPILRAPALEAKYGTPRYHVMQDGSYLAHYEWGKSMYLKIVGTQRPGSIPAYATDGSFDLMGKQQGSYGTGNEDPEFTSKITRLTAPDGRSANYVIVFGGKRDDIGQAGLSAAVPKFGW